jgi:hypothetical protein
VKCLGSEFGVQGSGFWFWFWFDVRVREAA